MAPITPAYQSLAEIQALAEQRQRQQQSANYRQYSNQADKDNETTQKNKNSIASNLGTGIAVDQALNDGRITSSIWEAGKQALGLGSGTAGASTVNGISGTTPVASSIDGGTVLANGTVAPMSPTGIQTGAEAGTPGFAVGEPSTAGYLAAALRAGRGVQAFLKDGYERDKNREAIWSGLMVPANVATGGLASLAEMGMEKFMSPNDAKNTKNAIIYSNPITAPIAAIASFAGSSKDKDQYGRDQVRATFKKNSFLDDGYNVTLADGTKFNIGVDGKAKPEYGIDPTTKKAMHAFDLDHSDPLVKQLVPMLNPLVNVLTGGNEKLASDFTGYLVRAAMSNSGGDVKKAMANVQAFYLQLKASPTALNSAIDKMLASKTIDAQTAAIWKDDIKKATAGLNFGDGAGGTPGGGISFPKTTVPKPAPQPYAGTVDAAASFASRQQAMQPAQQNNVAQLYSNFAKNFVPQSQNFRRQETEQQ